MSTFIYFFKNSMISFYSGSNTTLVFEKKNTRFYLNATEIFPVDFCILLSKYAALEGQCLCIAESTSSVLPTHLNILELTVRTRMDISIQLKRKKMWAQKYLLDQVAFKVI